MTMAAAPASTPHPLPLGIAPGFQKIDDASWHGEPVTAKDRDAAQVPISLMPKACARAAAGKMINAPITARYRVGRCRCMCRGAGGWGIGPLWQLIPGIPQRGAIY